MEEALEWIVDRVLKAYEGAPLQESLKAVADTLAVASAAPSIEGEAGVYAGRLAGGDAGPSIVLGLWVRRARLNAALANAFLAHSLEYDDWLAPGYVHAGSVTAPVILSYSLGHSLGEVLRVNAAAYEAALHVGSYFGRSHYMHWHSTATVGSVASAVSYTLLSTGPDPGIIAAAISHAVNYMGGLWRVNDAGTLYKPSSPAHAVHTGILGGVVASTGRQPIPGVLGEACRHLRGECLMRGHEAYAVSLNGYKFYPSCRHSHTVIEAAEEASREVDPTGIERVEVRVFKEAVAVAGKRNPRSVAEARFSIPYLVGVALSYGRVTFTSIRRGLGDPLVGRIAGLVELVEDPDYTMEYPERQHAHVRVYVKGSVVERHVEHPKGDPARGVSMADVAAKARSLYEESRDPRITRLTESLLNSRLEAPFTTIVEESMGTG